MASGSLNNYVSRKLSSHLVISPAFEISLESGTSFKVDKVRDLLLKLK